MIISMVLVVLLGVPFVLWWWRIADKWADEEARRFGRGPADIDKNKDAVVIKDFDRPDDA